MQATYSVFQSLFIMKQSETKFRIPPYSGHRANIRNVRQRYGLGLTALHTLTTVRGQGRSGSGCYSVIVCTAHITRLVDINKSTWALVRRVMTLAACYLYIIA